MGDGAEDHQIDILKKALSNVSQGDIEVFLFYETKMAVQIVNILKKDTFSPIDKETRSLALKIKNCPNYKLYEQQQAITQS